MQLNIHSFANVQEAMSYASDQIDSAAGEARARYLTTAVGQETVYLTKYQEALTYKEAGYSPKDGSGFLWIKTEAESTGTTPKDTADTILKNGNLWNSEKGPQIEGLRIGGKAAIKKLSSIQDILKSAYQTKNALNNV